MPGKESLAIRGGEVKRRHLIFGEAELFGSADIVKVGRMYLVGI